VTILDFFGNEYILLAVDYVLTWIEAIPTRTNEDRVVVKFLKENIFSRYSMPRAVISDLGTHFNSRSSYSLLKWYSTIHRIATPYHSQSNG